MTGRARGVQLAEATAAAGRHPGRPDAMLQDVASRLRRAVDFDGSTWFGLDPATLLPTWPVHIDGVEASACRSYWEREFHVPDVALFRDLAEAREPVGRLVDATHGLPRRSTRFVEYVQPQGYGDAMRAVFRSGPMVWGAVELLRGEGEAPFDARDAAVLQSVAGHVGEALRAHQLLSDAVGAAASDAPGLIVFDLDYNVVSANANAEAWLRVIPAGPGPGDLPLAVFSVAGTARAIQEGMQSGAARVRLRSTGGRWLVVHGMVLTDAGGRMTGTAVVLEYAQSAELAPIIVRAYGLSPREQQITRLIARGRSTGAIAEELHLSVYTVRDHVKAVFEKIGVRSRGELVALLFAEHYEAGLGGPGPSVDVLPGT